MLLGLLAAVLGVGVYAAWPRHTEDQATDTSEANVLNIYNWADYVAEDTIANFEREYGIKINYDVYDTLEIVEAKLLAGSSGYDVVLHASTMGARMIPVGVFQPLDRNQLNLWSNLDPWVLSLVDELDPGNLYGVPYLWGNDGYAINVDMIRERMPDAPLGSAAMLFDPDVVSRFADCGVTFLDSPGDMISMALQYLGYDLNSLDPGELAEAEAQLKKVKPYVRYFHSLRWMTDMPSGEVCLSAAWNGNYGLALDRAREVGADVNIAYYASKEGTQVWFDIWYVPADAPHPHNAHLFLNYLLRPEVIGAISNYTHYANANTAAFPFVREDIINDSAIYPSQEEREGWPIGYAFGPKEERIKTRIWSRVKTGL